MNSFEIGILGFLLFLYVYVIVDRICRCVEQINLARFLGANKQKPKQEAPLKEML